VTRTFSYKLREWLASEQPKTIANLESVFVGKSFAVAFLILMSIPALPLPTGGLSHLTEIITLLLATELLFGQQTPWLPKRWRNLSLGKVMEKKALPTFTRLIAWFERFSKPRLHHLLKRRVSLRLMGVVIILFTLGAFLAPPFSGLDTLPALGVVLIALSLLLEDIVILLLGLASGLAGIALEISLGSVLFHFLR